VRQPEIDLALVGRLIRRRWRVLTALALLGALLGFGLSFALSPGYVSDSKVLLQGERDKDQLPGESEVATSSIVLDRTAEKLGGGMTGVELRDRVQATVNGNVLGIHGAAESPEQARQLTQQVTTEYVAFAAQISGVEAPTPVGPSRADLQRIVDNANNTIRRLQSSPEAASSGDDGDRIRGEVQRAESDLARATAQLDRSGGGSDQSDPGSTTQDRPTGSVIEPATLPTGQSSPTMVQLIAAGALVLAAAGVVAHLLRLRLDRRLWDADEVGAALGAPVLGCVEVPRPSGPPRTGVSRHLHDDRRWTDVDSVPIEDARTRETRYRRIVGRVRSSRPAATGRLDLLVVMVEGDTAAVAPLAGLVRAATEDGPVRVIGADHDASSAVLRAADEAGVADRVSVEADTPLDTACTTFEVVTVSLAHPLVPDTGASAAVVVVTLGTRSGTELATVATACADAGRELVGVVPVLPRDTETPHEREDTAEAPEDIPGGTTDPATAGAGGS
jgi:capsular polysaccharide biosynthesis protein